MSIRMSKDVILNNSVLFNDKYYIFCEREDKILIYNNY